MAVYKAPIKDIQFVLNEVLDVSSLDKSLRLGPTTSRHLSSSHQESIPRGLTPQKDRETSPIAQETMMQLFEIALPDVDAQAEDYGYEIFSWKEKALELAGVYTVLGKRRGAWRDPKTDIGWSETMHWYQVACDVNTMSDLVVEAFRLFPDQKAIFHAYPVITHDR